MANPTRFFLAVLAAAGISRTAWAELTTPGAVQLNVPISARQAGMGDIALGGGDVMGGWSNPALLTTMASRGTVALGGISMLGGASTQFGLGAGWKLNPSLAIGLLGTGSSMSIKYSDPSGNENGSISQSVNSAGLAAAYRWQAIGAGIILKGISETLESQGNSAFGADVGLMAEKYGFTAAVSARNLGPNLRPSNGSVAGETLPQETRAGIFWRYEPLGLGAGAEAVMPAGLAARIGLGAEWWPVPMFAVRAGFRSNDGGSPNISAGLSAVFKGFGLDYSFTSSELGGTNRFVLSYGFGEVMGATAAAPGEARAEEAVKEPEPASVKPVALKPGAAKLNFAVSDLRAENVSAGDAAVIADLLRSELVKTGAFNVIEKQNMDKLLAEHAFQQTGCTSEECAIKLGKLLNVQRMAVGSFGKLLDSYMVNIRVVNVETGEVSFAESVEGQTVSVLRVGVKDLAKKMAAQVR